MRWVLCGRKSPQSHAGCRPIVSIPILRYIIWRPGITMESKHRYNEMYWCINYLYIHIWLYRHTYVVMSTDDVTDRHVRYKSCASHETLWRRSITSSPEVTRSHTRPGPSGVVHAVHRFHMSCHMMMYDIHWCTIYIHIPLPISWKHLFKQLRHFWESLRGRHPSSLLDLSELS